MSERNDSVLIVDDEPAMLEAMARTLEISNYRVLSAREIVEATRVLDSETVHTVLLDLRLPGVEGFEGLDRIRRDYPLIPVIVITAYGGVPEAVQATKRGAFDFLEKSGSRDRLLISVRNACDRGHLEAEKRGLVANIQEANPLIGRSEAMREIQRLIARAAPTEEPVLIVGDTGTGKEVVARALFAQSRRAGKPFVAVNCAAIVHELAESELFGHRRGAFTGAIENKVGKFKSADGGTLFLDEIGDMSMALQAKVLRALQDGEIEPVGNPNSLKVNVRIIAATNRDLETQLKEHSFRQDLYYRLSGIVLRIPSLRERREDVYPLLLHFLEQAAEKQVSPVPTVSPGAVEALMACEWPGNVRQLERCAGWLLTFGGPEISFEDVQEWLGHGLSSSQSPVRAGRDYVSARQAFEREYFSGLLDIHKGNISAVARAADLDRSGLHRKLKALGLVDGSP